jgi:hypothetical protein
MMNVSRYLVYGVTPAYIATSGGREGDGKMIGAGQRGRTSSTSYIGLTLNEKEGDG